VAKPVRSRDLLSALAAHFPILESHSKPLPDAPIHRSETGNTRAEPLPDLPGIDCQVGLTYANGKPEIYRKILRMFRESHSHEFEPALRRALAQDDWPTAARSAHTLKGSARTIGASELGNLAQALEDACLARQQIGIDRLLGCVLNELDRVSIGLEKADLD